MFMLIVTGVQAQDHEGVWEMTEATIHLIKNGINDTIHTLTDAEIEKKSVPVTLELGRNTATITRKQKRSVSNYVSEKGRTAQTLSDAENQKKYTFWLINKDTLVMTSDYGDGDYKGNELRLTYKRK